MRLQIVFLFVFSASFIAAAPIGNGLIQRRKNLSGFTCPEIRAQPALVGQDKKFWDHERKKTVALGICCCITLYATLELLQPVKYKFE